MASLAGSGLMSKAGKVLGRALTAAAADPKKPLQVYFSRDRDPHINLSIEQHLLEASHPDSTVLFLYANAPSVIIGRSQNPWLETDLARLRAGLPIPAPGPVLESLARSGHLPSALSDQSAGHDRNNVPVDLVRRRSGGGTVFHDWGNMNYSVIFPTAAFDRDRHAEMVARALGQGLRVPGVRVNERHDIVMDVVDGEPGPPSSSSSSTTPTTTAAATFKISGSAYRVTRLRSLHHGTCLLSSPYLPLIGSLLRSPAEPFLRSRGVGSVRSPVRNVNGTALDDAGPVGLDRFQQAVVDQFAALYRDLVPEAGVFVADVGSDALEIPEVAKGVAELRSPEWKFCQTPQFSFATHPTEDDPRARTLPSDLPPDFRASMTIRYGKIIDCDMSGLDYVNAHSSESQVVPPPHATLNGALVGQSIHEITDWRSTLARASQLSLATPHIGRWLNRVFGNDGQD